MPDFKGEVRKAIGKLDLDLAREEAIAEELAEPLEARYAELLAEGVAADVAYRAVLEELNEEKLRAELRPLVRPSLTAIPPGSKPSNGFWAGVGWDLRMAARQLRLNPGFALVALLSLALGVGANAAIFELIDAVVLRTLPVPEPHRLAEVRLIHGGRIGNTVARQKDYSVAIWEQLRQRQEGFSSIAAWSTEGFNLGHGGEVRNADGLWVSGSFFDVLQLHPMLGRLLAPSDDLKGCGVQGAVISYGFWQSEFGGRANAIGSTVSLDRHAFQIVGVTPPTFTGLETGRKFDVALPMCSEAALHGVGAWSNDVTTWWLTAIGRLKPGWNLKRANAQLESVSPEVFAATLPPTYDAVARKDYLRFSLHADPAATGNSPLRRQFEQPLWVLLGISGLVLLIACANIANLTLARASARQREMALRLALGAARARIVRQLLVESLLLSVLGTAAGAVLALLLGRALIAAIATTQDQVYLSLSLDWRMLAFTTCLALLTCVVFGVAPAFQAAATEPGAVVKAAGRSVTTGRKLFLLRRGFIAAQIALSLVLVVAAMLFVRTFQNLVHTSLGFEQQGILVVGFDSSALNLPPGSAREYKRNLLDQVRAIPGVSAAAETSIVPLSGDGWNEFIDIPNTAMQRKLVDFSSVSQDYFQTLEVPLLAGRNFNASDTPSTPLVAIVNRSFARTYLGNSNASSGAFGIRQDGGKPDKIYRIIGLVGDTKYREVREDYAPIAYVAASQDANPDLGSTILVRSSEDTASLISSLKNVAAKNSSEIVLSFSVMRTSIREHLGRERLMAALSGFYGALAALLATIGLYGIMAFSVARRRAEIGIRMALGATRRGILGMILREAFAILAIGVLAGTILAFASGRVVQTMLYGLHAFDPLTMWMAIAGMILVTLVASLLPARRAAAIEPMQTLRDE